MTQRQGKDCWERPNGENSLGKVSSCLGLFSKKNDAKTSKVEVEEKHPICFLTVDLSDVHPEHLGGKLIQFGEMHYFP